MDDDFSEKALPVLELWIKEHPDNIDAKVGKDLLQAQLKQFDLQLKPSMRHLRKRAATQSNIPLNSPASSLKWANSKKRLDTLMTH